MENLIYWNGVVVGIDCGNYTSWFPSAPQEAINDLAYGLTMHQDCRKFNVWTNN